VETPRPAGLAAALAHYRLALDKLDRHGSRNSGYERNRAATLQATQEN
jgi:hypothetical protein